MPGDDWRCWLRLALFLTAPFIISACAALAPALIPAALPSFLPAKPEAERHDGWIGCKGGDVMVRGDAACPPSPQTKDASP